MTETLFILLNGFTWNLEIFFLHCAAKVSTKLLPGLPQYARKIYSGSLFKFLWGISREDKEL